MQDSLDNFGIVGTSRSGRSVILEFRSDVFSELLKINRAMMTPPNKRERRVLRRNVLKAGVKLENHAEDVIQEPSSFDLNNGIKMRSGKLNMFRQVTILPGEFNWKLGSSISLRRPSGARYNLYPSKRPGRVELVKVKEDGTEENLRIFQPINYPYEITDENANDFVIEVDRKTWAVIIRNRSNEVLEYSLYAGSSRSSDLGRSSEGRMAASAAMMSIEDGGNGKKGSNKLYWWAVSALGVSVINGIVKLALNHYNPDNNYPWHIVSVSLGAAAGLSYFLNKWSKSWESSYEENGFQRKALDYTNAVTQYSLDYGSSDIKADLRKKLEGLVIALRAYYGRAEAEELIENLWKARIDNSTLFPDTYLFVSQALSDQAREVINEHYKDNSQISVIVKSHSEAEPGGIDLNTSNGMQWKDSKDGHGVEMNIDPAMVARIRREGIDSLSPVIFKITPITSIWPLVGLQA